MNTISIKHIPTLNEWKCDELDYFPYDLSNVTCYNPIYSNFEKHESSNTNIQFNHSHHFYDNKNIIDCCGNISSEDIFFKYGPILDPCHYMMGKYKYDKNITTIVNSDNDDSIEYHEKVKSIHNASYVDNFTCALINLLYEKYNFKHGVRYFGSIVGVQNKFRMNIADDIEFIQEHDFFQQNIGNLFHTNIFSKGLLQNEATRNTLKHKKSLSFSDEIQIDDFDDMSLSPININHTLVSSQNCIEIPHQEPELIELSIDNLKEHTYIHNNCDNSNNHIVSIDSNDNSSDDSEISHTDSMESQQNDDIDVCNDELQIDLNSSNGSSDFADYESSIDEEPLYAYIDNFPVIMIGLSKCEDTFDTLLNDDKDLDTHHYLSALFQIIMIILTLQKAFNFTHNDLHTNNIMYETTTITHIYYIFNNVQYKVPTYGRIFKLIDFGRSIVTYNNTIYCSDSFKQDGDANTQYNFGPFYDQTKKCINPNYSFDLCRLGCSIYDFIIDDEENIDNFDDFQKLIYEWCCDDSGKNILYKKNGDERYPNFKLYKMIARIVHNHTPEKQLEREIFKKYQTQDTPDITIDCVINIDNIPSFA